MLCGWAQAWQDNPRTSMIEHLEAGDLLVLDLSQRMPSAMGGVRHQKWCRRKGDMDNSGWVYCMSFVILVVI